MAFVFVQMMMMILLLNDNASIHISILSKVVFAVKFVFVATDIAFFAVFKLTSIAFDVLTVAQVHVSITLKIYCAPHACVVINI